jgi:UDP-N-acetylmuramoylalanine--D-glutamate ligase
MGRVPVLVDDEPPGAELDGLKVWATDGGGLEQLTRCEAVVKSPGISRYRAEARHLEAAGVAVCGGLGLFMEEADPARVACVTGTKGKSTTTALAVHLLNGLGYDARAGGNIGHPPWDPAGGPAPDYWVIETSSFQVPDLYSGPAVVAVTSLSPDHLDWHGSVERYYADKLSLCIKPGVAHAVANGSDPELRARSDELGPNVQWVGADDVERDRLWSEELALRGSHNARNASIARAMILALGILADDGALAAAAEGFSALPSRCHSLGRVGTVEFVDDSLATNVLPTQAALEAFDGRAVALLVGGQDRGVDYAPLGRSVARRTEPTLVVTMPDNGPRIGAAVRGAIDSNDAVEVVDAPDLASAVEAAHDWAASAEAGGVVLLSPAAPSFGRYRDYEERADAFARAAARYGPRPMSPGLG